MKYWDGPKHPKELPRDQLISVVRLIQQSLYALPSTPPDKATRLNWHRNNPTVHPSQALKEIEVYLDFYRLGAGCQRAEDQPQPSQSSDIAPPLEPELLATEPGLYQDNRGTDEDGLEDL